MKIAVLMVGNVAPGGNNIFDGLLRFKRSRKGTNLMGYLNGVQGLASSSLLTISEESFAPYRNLGGYDYLGKTDEILVPSMFPVVADQCKKHGFTGLVLVGATHTMTDALRLSEYLLEHEVDTKVVVIPATLDGNIRHQFYQCSLGFDTAAKVYSQLIGNMLTDSASAIKYWYFIRLMGKDPSHLALECALRTHPNMVIISEESSFRQETLVDIVERICDVIQQRANQNKNYGSVLIPEGLLSHISAYKYLIGELNAMFEKCKNTQESITLQQSLLHDDSKLKEILSPWSFSLYITLPDFMKRQLVTEQQINGEVNLSQIETEKLIAYFVDLELKKRKEKGVYKGTFSPVTHFFGYQGRGSHPSLFDCSLGSTLGFASAALLEAGLNGMAVSVKDLPNKPSTWRIGGVPILASLRSQPKAGYKRNQLVVSSQEVNLTDLPYQILKANELSWRFVDHYCNPGPIQYEDFGKTSISDTITCLYQVDTDVTS